jgi:hypothetical protein
VKRLSETQLFKDELKEVNELNSLLLARNQELEAQLAKESQAKMGKCFTDLLFYDKTKFKQSSELITTSIYSSHGAAHDPWHSSQ